jgi:hypothetical protein
MEPSLQTTRLSYSQTLFRMLAFMGREVVVSTTVNGGQATGPILCGVLAFADPLDRRRDGEPGEAHYFALEGGGGFVLASDEFVEGEVAADVLRIESAALTLWVSLAQVD